MYWLRIESEILSQKIEKKKPAELQIDVFVTMQSAWWLT